MVTLGDHWRMSDKLYRMQEKAKYDKLQTQLSFTKTDCKKECYKCKNKECKFYNLTITPNNNSYAQVPILDQIKGKELTCPYCINTNKSENYKPTNRIDITECPNCKNHVMYKTLIYITSLKDVSEFAEWVYNNRINEFFQKINFEKFNEKLFELGISREFWDNYKRLKGENQQNEE